MKPMEACSYVWQNCNLVVRPLVSAPALRVSSSPTCRKSLCFLTPVSIVDIRVQSVFVSRLGLSEAGWHDIYSIQQCGLHCYNLLQDVRCVALRRRDVPSLIIVHANCTAAVNAEALLIVLQPRSKE